MDISRIKKTIVETVKSPVVQRKADSLRMKPQLEKDIAELSTAVKQGLKESIDEIEDFISPGFFKRFLAQKSSGYAALATSTSATAKGILEIIKKAEKNKIAFTKEDLIKILESRLQQEFEIPASVIPKLIEGDYFQLKSHDYLNKRMYSNFISLMKKTPQKQGETFSQYFSRIVKLREKRVKQLEKFRIDNIRTKLKYGDDTKDNLINLSEKEQKELIDFLNKHITLHNNTNPHKQKLLKPDASFERIVAAWQDAYIGGGGTLIDSPTVEKASTAVLQRLGRYNSRKPMNTVEKYDVKISEKHYKSEYINEPVYRWLEFNNPDRFIETLPKTGEIYDPKRFQSCSTNRNYAEMFIGDHVPSQNVKFIIHPKSETSKAYNLGYNQEVIYTPETKFKILDKELIEDLNPKSQTSTCRWEVHMQEI